MSAQEVVFIPEVTKEQMFYDILGVLEKDIHDNNLIDPVNLNKLIEFIKDNLEAFGDEGEFRGELDSFIVDNNQVELESVYKHIPGTVEHQKIVDKQLKAQKDRVAKQVAAIETFTEIMSAAMPGFQRIDAQSISYDGEDTARMEELAFQAKLSRLVNYLAKQPSVEDLFFYRNRVEKIKPLQHNEVVEMLKVVIANYPEKFTEVSRYLSALAAYYADSPKVLINDYGMVNHYFQQRLPEAAGFAVLEKVEGLKVIGRIAGLYSLVVKTVADGRQKNVLIIPIANSDQVEISLLDPGTTRLPDSVYVEYVRATAYFDPSMPIPDYSTLFSDRLDSGLELQPGERSETRPRDVSDVLERDNRATNLQLEIMQIAGKRIGDALQDARRGGQVYIMEVCGKNFDFEAAVDHTRQALVGE